jgi:hypothetical protein
MRTLVRLLAIALLIMPSQVLGVEAGVVPRDSLRLELSLDEKRYAQGQPILVLAKVRNAGPRPFRDLSPLAPWLQRLWLTLKRDGRPVRWMRGSADAIYRAEGMKLPQGATICEIFDLLDYFGSLGGMATLPAGHYELWATFYARTGFVTLPNVRTEGVGVFFEVTDDSLELPPESVLAASTKRELIEGNAKTKAIYLIWRNLLVTESDYPIHDAINLLRANGRSPLLAGAMIHRWCKLMPDSERAAWIAKTRISVAGESDLEALLDSWELWLKERGW